MRFKKSIIITLFLCLLMIGSVSAATDNLDDVVKSDATHKETIKHTHTTTTDTSSEKIVEKTNTNTINEKKSINNDKKEEKEEEDEVEVNKLSTTTNNDLLKEGTDNGTFTTLNKNNDKDTLKETQPINNWNDLKNAINNGTEDIKLTNDITTNGERIIIDGKVRINGDGHTIDAEKKGTDGIFSLRYGASLILENLKIINGQNGFGGAISTEANCNLTVTNCTFNQNTATYYGGAICTEFNCNLTVTNCTFNQNNATQNSGGAISTGYNCNLTVTNCTFNQNNANDMGGAIYTGFKCNLTVTNCTFNQNTATYGGAIYTQSKCNLTVTNCTFNQNNANGEGGAIRISVDCDVNVDNALFCNNNAQSGDSIYCSGGSGTRIIKNSAFINDGYNGISAEGKIEQTNDIQSFTALNAIINTGNLQDSINLEYNYTYNSNSDNENYKNGIKITRDVTINGNGHTISGNQEARIFKITKQTKVTITNTTLTQGQGQTETINGNDWNVGGAIYTNNATITLINTKFNQNNATYGGAIHAYNGATININNTTFNQNNATYGGAITAWNGATVNINNTQFNKNNATLVGGAIYAYNGATVNINNTTFNQNNATLVGGAIYADGATVNINNTQFKQNTANSYGGAISAWNGATVNINNTTFKQNTANNGDGGAIYATSSATVNIINTQFSGNKAKSFGGAIYASGVHVIVVLSSIVGSTADCGSAIRAVKSSYITINNACISNNIATNDGAISVEDSYVNITRSNITNNTADYGGAIYTTRSEINIIYTSFIKNTAESPENGGGAIYIDENSKINITNSLFTDNKANTTGAAIYARKFDNIKITNNIFLNNTNTENSIIYLDKKDTGFAFKYNLDYNWFANNATNYNIKPDVTINNTGVVEELSNWLFLNATADSKDIPLLSSSDVSFDLYLYNSSSNNVSHYDYSQLQIVNLTITSVNGDVTPEIVVLGESTTYTKTAIGIGTVTASISNVKQTIIINKYPTTFIITITNSTTDKPININVNETYGFTGNVTITIDGKHYNLTLQNGEGTLNTITINKTGQYNATITFKGDETYNATKATSNTFTIKYPTEFTIDNIPDITEGDTITLTVNEKNNYTGPVNVTIGSENYTVTLINGSGKTTVTPKLKLGTYNATIRFNGDETYTNTTTTSNSFKINTKPTPTPTPSPVPVGKQNTKILAKNKIYKPNKYKTYTVTVKNRKGKPVTKTRVKLRIGKKTYTSKTNKKGIATFKIKNKKTKKNTKSKKKSYKITATLNKNAKKDKLTLKMGTKTYNTKTNNNGKGTFKIKTNKNKIRKYSITLKTTNGQVVKKQKVTLKVNKKTYKATTNTKGKATFKITNLNKKGKYKTTIKYNGNPEYNKSTKKVKITIKE